MKFLKKLQRKYVKARGKKTFADEFVLNKDFNEFLKKYPKLKDDFHEEHVPQGAVESPAKYDIDEESFVDGKETDAEDALIKVGRLSPKVASEVKRIYEIYDSHKYGEKRFEDTEKGIKKQVYELLTPLAVKMGVPLKQLEVSVDFDQEYDYYAGEIRVDYGDSFEKFEPQGLYMQGYNEGFDRALDDSDPTHAYLWLGIEGSPFYDSSFVDDYNYDAASQWFHEAASFEGDEDTIINGVRKMIEQEKGDQEDADKEARIKGKRRSTASFKDRLLAKHNPSFSDRLLQKYR